MTCDEVMELMQRHLDGDLNNGEYDQMRDHLEDCQECAEMMERLESIDKDLASLPRVAPAFSIVDSILPRLQELDASGTSGGSELTGAWAPKRLDAAASERRQDGAGKRLPRPWYARTRFAQISGLAAAAALLGILIVSGLPESFGGSSNSSQQESSASGASPEVMTMMDSAPASDSKAANKSSARMAPSAEESATAESDMDTAVSNKPEPRQNVAQEAEDAVSVMEAPVAYSSEPQPNEAMVQGFGGGEDGSPETGSAAAEGEVSLEGAEVSPVKASGTVYGIASDPAPSDDVKAQDQYGDPAAPGLRSENGVYSVLIEQLPEGMLAVRVSEVEGASDYTSIHQWSAEEAVIELQGWNESIVTYTVTTQEGIRTFAIDASGAIETEVKSE